MKSVNPALSILLAEIKSDPRVNLKVPKALKFPDVLVQKSKEYLEERKGVYLDNGLIRSYEHLDMQVSPKNLDRSLCFMDTLIKALKARGHAVHNENRNTYAVIRDQKIKISFREKLKITSSRERYSSRKLDPTGLLNFRAEVNFNVKEWLDGKETVEEQLPRILTELELQGDRLFDAAIERKKYWDEQQAKDKLLKDEIQRQENELMKFKELLRDAGRWQDARRMRDYAKQLKNPSEKERCLKMADWYDPRIELNYELLKDVDRHTLALKKMLVWD